MPSYEDTMRTGQGEYQDVLDLLQSAGLPAEFVQTGGMCAALEITLDSGHTLLVTDEQGPLPWDRASQQGWMVGLYPPGQSDGSGDCSVLDGTPQGGAEDLLLLVRRVLDAPAAQLQAGSPAPGGAPA